MRHQDRAATLTLALAAFCLPVALQAQPPGLPAPTNLTVLFNNGDQAATGQGFLTTAGERVAARLAQGDPKLGTAPTPTFDGLGLSSDEQLTRDDIAAAQVTRRPKTTP